MKAAARCEDGRDVNFVQAASKHALRREGRALDERPYGVRRKPVRNSRRDVGIAPYAEFWIGRNAYRFLRRAGSPEPAAPGTIVFIHIAS